MSLAFFEFKSMATGLLCIDAGLKAAAVTLKSREYRCPGRLRFMLSGSESAIEQAAKAIEAVGSEDLLSLRLLLRLDERLTLANNRPLELGKGSDLLVVETRHLVEAYALANQWLLHHPMEDLSVADRLGLFGKGLLLVAASPTVVKTLYQDCLGKKKDLVFRAQVIQNPSPIQWA